MKRRHLLWWIVAGPCAVLLAIMVVAHPYLAITERSGGDVLVVEGWMEMPQLKEAVPLALDARYTHVYTTGTVRPFTYYLRQNEGIDVVLRKPAQGELSINVSGVDAAGFTVTAGNDTVLHRAVTGAPQLFRTRLDRPVEQLRVTAWNTNTIDPHSDDIFILSFRVGGTDLHELQRETLFIRPEGRMEHAWPTYAHRAKGLLMEYGVPEERITAVPTWGHPDSRTWANASTFGVRAREDGVTAFDIATVGVHARRSRALFQQACGPDVRVGVISIPDPYCTATNWWRSKRGWATLLKEVIGSPEAQAVELTR